MIEPVPAFLVVSATRYALGRATYIVPETARWLVAHWTELDPYTKAQVLSDVRQALEDGRAGWECDKEEWARVLAMADALPTVGGEAVRVHTWPRPPTPCERLEADD